MNHKKIVVVDDDDAVRAIVCSLAHEAMPCAEIAEHTSSLRALHDVESGMANLLITNCHMPDMSGPTLVQTIRKMKNSIPIIMVSGSPEARQLGEDAGIDKFVEKSHLNAELPDAIYSVLEAS